MKQKIFNQVTIVGYLYQHSLEIKTVTEPTSENYGKPYIRGTIEVATDEDGLNVIPVRFRYVAPTYKDKRPNETYNVLQSIIEGAPTWIENGKEAAAKVKCDSTFALNDFYDRNDQLVSAMVQEGGFVNFVNQLPPLNKRNNFTVDLLITNVNRTEADEERNIKEDFCTVRGGTFNYQRELLPLTFKITNPQGMTFFEDLDVSSSNPVFLKVWGDVINKTISVERFEESAFGEAAVTSYERKVKEWIITGSAKAPYEYGDENVLTENEVVEAMQKRQVHLAEIKQRQDEYKASQAANGFATPAPAAMPAPTQSSAPRVKTPFDF